ncbi:MAG: hypothetical protein R2712_24335 [Vicinamibacterales bacterium]
MSGSAPTTCHHVRSSESTSLVVSDMPFLLPAPCAPALRLS